MHILNYTKCEKILEVYYYIMIKRTHKRNKDKSICCQENTKLFVFQERSIAMEEWKVNTATVTKEFLCCVDKTANR